MHEWTTDILVQCVGKTRKKSKTQWFHSLAFAQWAKTLVG